MRPIHSQRLERWLGSEAEKISAQMRGWYGPPIMLASCPGRVYVAGDGDFYGKLKGGFFSGAADYARELWQRSRRVRHGTLFGFAGFADLLSEARCGKYQFVHFSKNINGTVQGARYDLWDQGPNPPAGTLGAAAPGGTVYDRTSTGAMAFQPPISGDTLHYFETFDVVHAEDRASSHILIDQLFRVAKTMNSTANEAVTGVPTRYQGTTPGAEDFPAGNFLYVAAGATALAATAHNWDNCLYTDQDGNTGVTLPTLTGISSCAARRFDFGGATLPNWFAPLAAGDTGIKALTQMHCSAAVATGTIQFVIAHPIAFYSSFNNLTLSFGNFEDTVGIAMTTGFHIGSALPRVFDDACLALINMDGNTNAVVAGSFSLVSG